MAELAIADAAEYARAHGLHALVVERDGRVVASEYGESFSPDEPHALYSGTKSFWGVAALFAQDDGLLQLDEPVAETFSQWRADPWKRRVTLRMLLSLTAGFGFGGLGASVPVYERALDIPLKDEPGTRFTYGGVPLQVFGAVLARKLESRKLSPHDYLRERVLDPAGVRVAAWRTLGDGTNPLPTGASLRADDWLAYGRWVLGRARIAATLLRRLRGERAIRPLLVDRRSRRTRGSRVRKRLCWAGTLLGSVARRSGRALRTQQLVPPRSLLKAALRQAPETLKEARLARLKRSQ